MTVTADYAAEHFEELAAAAMQGDEVSIARADGALLDLRARRGDPGTIAPRLDENGLRVLGAGQKHLRRPLREADIAEMDRDWDENVIAKLWMNSDEE